MQHYFQRARLLIVAALISLLLAACGGEQDADSNPRIEVSDGESQLEFDPKLDNFGRPMPVKLCHRTESGAYPFVTIYADPSEVELHRLHGDVVPAPPEGCGDILDVDVPPLPGGPIDPVDGTSLPPTATATQVQATTIPTTAPLGPVVTHAPTDPPVAGRCAEGQTLANIVTSEKQYKEIAAALYQSGLLTSLADATKTYLIFIPDKKVKRDELTDFLLAHVVVIDHPVSSTEVLAQSHFTTLGGQSIRMTADDDKLMLNGNNRAKPILTACNGVIYAIEHPLNEQRGGHGDGNDVEDDEDDD